MAADGPADESWLEIAGAVGLLALQATPYPWWMHVAHLPDATSPSWAPLDGPPVLPGGRPHWLLTELDPVTLQARRATLVPDIPRDVGADENGTVWLVARGLRRCTGDTGSRAEPVEVAALMAAPDATARPTPTWGRDGSAG